MPFHVWTILTGDGSAREPLSMETSSLPPLQRNHPMGAHLQVHIHRTGGDCWGRGMFSSMKNVAIGKARSTWHSSSLKGNSLMITIYLACLKFHPEKIWWGGVQLPLRFRIQTLEDNHLGKKERRFPGNQEWSVRKIKSHREIEETEHNAGKDVAPGLKLVEQEIKPTETRWNLGTLVAQGEGWW